MQSVINTEVETCSTTVVTATTVVVTITGIRIANSRKRCVATVARKVTSLKSATRRSVEHGTRTLTAFG